MDKKIYPGSVNMGKCVKCEKKIEYNNFVVINGAIYHRECAPKPVPESPWKDEPINKEFVKKVDEKLRDAIGGKLKLTIEKKVCKFCGARNSKEWLAIGNGEWCCKKRVCRKKASDDAEEEVFNAFVEENKDQEE